MREGSKWETSIKGKRTLVPNGRMALMEKGSRRRDIENSWESRWKIERISEREET